MAFTIEMTLGGVLLAGNWRTEAELIPMTEDDKRNTLIVEMIQHSKQDVGYFQSLNNNQLIGDGAMVVFLLRARIRDVATLKTYSDGDQRNTLIVENNKRTNTPVVTLQSYDNITLVKIGLDWYGRVLSTLEVTLRGVLLAGNWRTEEESNQMTDDDKRNALISAMTTTSNQDAKHFQSLNNDDLVGVGAVVVFLLQAGVRDLATLKTYSDQDQRNTLIVENNKRFGIPVETLQGFGNKTLVQIGLEWYRKVSFTMEMTLRGVLLAGNWRTEAELIPMTEDDKRNTLIVEMIQHSKQDVGYFQSLNNNQLIGDGAMVVFLLRARIRDVATLKTYSDGDQRNTLIVENNKRTNIPVVTLQSYDNIKLAQIGIEWYRRQGATKA